MKLFNSEIQNKISYNSLEPGEIHYVNNLFEVGTNSGIIHIHEIQLESKKRMPVSQFIAGYPQIKNNYFG